MSGPRTTLPTRSLLQGCEYVSAASTDIRARFKAIAEQQRAQLKPAAVVRRAKP